ncbi:hypothetical protein FE257_010031 [Aspergillus nanangensis]|uniref:Xylanolytic transcriptional activator regulatory domain-containing protein n=1 Tax=Aspergillus nanangensis TaxID=2582783 RepID=A0AAD4GYF4_ASPNN|nr:hypothetical protein FE257_010031 [Aspergillus nanangensis]
MAEPAKNEGILERLQKLEEAVFGARQSQPSLQDSSLLPASARQLSPTILASPRVTEEHELASKLLQGIGTHENLMVEPISQILEDQSKVRHKIVNFLESIKLPTKAEALSLFNYYLDNVHYLHPVIHPESVEQTIEDVYMDAYTQQCSKPSQVVLLLSILASSSHQWRPQGVNDLIHISPKEAIYMSSIWSNVALDLLDYLRRTTSASIETIQATGIVSYAIYNTQGFSPILRSLHSILVAMARDLSLHEIDSPRKKRTQSNSQANALEDEIKRRIWWFIASTDWLLAFTPGPQEGIYSIQTQHMCVNHPKSRLGDDDEETIQWFLQRIRLAELCRTVVDSLPRFLERPETMDYKTIIDLDSKLQGFTESLPDFFRFGRNNDTENLGSQLNAQRYLIHIGVNTRRIKLHQPFLVRGFIEPKYTFSRNACLSSSRAILEVCHMLEEKKKDLAFIPARLASVVHHVFMAAVVLVMDLCFNKDEGREEQRQEEVSRACRMIDGWKDESIMATQFLEPIMNILRKHKNRVLQQPGISSALLHPASSDNIMLPGPRNPSRDDGMHTTVDECDLPASPDAHQCGLIQADDDDWDFDSMMQNYIDLGQNVDANTWDDIFADLGSFQTFNAGGNGLYG